MDIAFDTIALIGVVIFNGVLGLTIYLRNVKSRVNVLYALSVITVIVWAIVNYATNHIAAHASQLLVNRLSFAAGLLTVISVWVLSSFFPAKSPNFTFQNKISLLFIPVLFVTTFTPLIVKNVTFNRTEQLTSISLGTFYVLYIVSILTFLGFIVTNFRRAYINSSGISRSQILYSSFGIVLACFWVLLTTAVIPAVTHNWSVSKIGSLGTIFYIGTTGYAIVRHRLFDIRIVIARSVAYALLISTLAVLYAGSVFSLSKLLFSNDRVSTGQSITNIILAVILATTFQSLRRFFQQITNNIFYRDHYDAQTLLSNLGAIMSREIVLDNLTSKVINELTGQMRLSKAFIIVLDNKKIFFEANNEPTKYQDFSLQELESLGSGIVIRDAMEGGTIPEVFDKYGISVSVDLRSSNELVGYLLLGEKKSGDIYNSGDIKTLGILAHELAIAIHNAKSYSQIQSFNQTLQKRIDDATVQLRKANVRLQKLDGVKNEFLSMATHQLNTPLAVIDGYLSMIIDTANTNNDLPSQDREFIQKSLHRVHLMKRLVSDFLNVSRIETGTFAIELKPMDMNRLVTEEVNTLGLAAKEKQVLLRYFPPKHPVPIIEIDEQKTRQAVMNLIDNAIYYAPKGDVKVLLDSDNQNITFKVVDNGIGVPQDQKSKLFQKFSRATNAVKERPSGTGVGLFLVKRVVEDQGGSIIFQSTEGQGSTFGFSLPVKTKEEDVPIKAREPGPVQTAA